MEHTWQICYPQPPLEVGMPRMRRVGAVFIILFLLVGFSPAHNSASPEPKAESEILLSGSDWKLGSFEMGQGEKDDAFQPGFDDRTFKTVRVPGEVQLQVGLQGMDLYYQSKSLSLINQKEWWYRKTFFVGKSAAGKLLRLKFDGVDYFASVWLNGEKLGEHEGSYVRFSYDVTSKIRFEKPNVLAVKVTCPWIPKGRGFLEYMKGDWTTIDPENQLHINQPPFFLGPYWDGIPADGNAAFPMGLSRDVKLASSGSSAIGDLFVSTKSLQQDGSAALEISGTITNYSQVDSKAVLKFEISPDNFQGESLTLPAQMLTLHPGENSVAIETRVNNAKLWWTWDLGEQNLYKLTGTLVVGKNTISDTRETVFGIRTIALKPDMSYWLNGKRLFLKGAWYPMSDYYGSKPTRETFEKDLLLFRAANLNHLVAFTVVEKSEFYDLCDRLGILEIFEFPFNQDGPIDVLSYSNPRREIFVRQSLSQVRQIILELRNHPSIIEWAAFAEAHAKGGGWGVGSWDFEQYGYGPYSEAVGKMVADLAPGTIYHPSLCDLGEQHFWMGNAGMGNTDSYNQHFRAHTGFVSEYGSLSLPVVESWKKEISGADMWSDSNNNGLPRWHGLPINISAYSYLSSFDYDGVASLFDRINQYVDRHIKSIEELIDDSQLYQAFLMKYATEAYRRKKYNPVNGTRFWDYGEVWPGIRWGIIDYFRIPKMSYYSIKQAQARLAINFAFENSLESQPSGKKLEIPVWIINDYAEDFNAQIRCEILDLTGHMLWTGNFVTKIPADDKKEVSTIEWITPDTPGVYVLRGQVITGDKQPQALTSTFIKVTPRLFSREINLLLIGQKKYSVPIRELVEAMGVNVDVIDEESIPRLSELSDSDQLRKKYEVIWLAAFDSFWKLLDKRDADGLREAIQKGTGFIHTGGRASFHGGFGEGACLDFTPLADLLPVEIQNRYDLVLGEADERTNFFSQFSPLKNIQLADDAQPNWSDGGLSAFGLSGFNQTKLKSGAHAIMNIDGRPLLVSSKYGQGRTVAFTGFTPAYREERADWDPKITYSYLVDQELYRQPVTKAYLYIFMELLAAASGEKPQLNYDSFISARGTPLFETLKDLPLANIKVSVTAEKMSADGATFSVQLRNDDHYARLLRLRTEWKGEDSSASDLVLYDDNYFDLLPGEARVIQAKLPLIGEHVGHLGGKLFVQGTNVERKDIPIDLDGIR
jgi:beta-mannosidase